MITEKELIITIRLLDLYNIDKYHKNMLNTLKALSINDWYDFSNKLISRYSEDNIKQSINKYKKHSLKTNKQQYLQAYKIW